MVTVQGESLDFDDVVSKYDRIMEWLAGVYVNAMNVIRYMHDKYAHERLGMALFDYAPLRTISFGMAGMSVADGLSAIRYARVRVVGDPTGPVTDYQVEGDFQQFGNNDSRVDQLACWVVHTFTQKLRKYPTYRNAVDTQSILTITSNVVYRRDRLTDADKIDLVPLDIKGWDADRHRHLTGREVGPVLDFARRPAAGTKRVWVRFMSVPGLTDHLEEIDQIARFAAGLGNVARVDVLRFHQDGRCKWKELGLNYTLDHTEPPWTEALGRVCAQWRAAGLTAC